MNKLQKKYNIVFPPKSHTQPGFHLSHGSLKAAQPPIGRPGCHSQLHLPPTWWRFRTKVTRPVHYAHKRHNKSPCWEKWDPSAPKGHNNKFPSGSSTHGPEPGTTTIIYLTQRKKKNISLLLQQAVFHQAAFCSDLIQVVSTFISKAMFTLKKKNIKLAVKQQTHRSAVVPDSQTLHEARKNKR